MVVGCRPYAPVAFTPRKYSWYSFLLEAESTPWPWCDRRDFMSMKYPLTPAGIKPVTYRFVAQLLNHCATADPLSFIHSLVQQHPPVSTASGSTVCSLWGTGYIFMYYCVDRLPSSSCYCEILVHLRYFTFITVKSLALERKEIKLKFQITHFGINENFKAVCCRLLPTPFWCHHPHSRFHITPSRRTAGETWEPFSPVTLFDSHPPYTNVRYSSLPLCFLIQSSILVFRLLLWFGQKSACLLRTTLCVCVWMYVRAE